MTARNRHIGSGLDDFLSDEGLLEEVSTVANQRVISWQISEAMKASAERRPPQGGGVIPARLSR